MPRVAACSLLLTVACVHSDPVSLRAPDRSDAPLAGGAPTRVTYDPGMDLHPSWAPSGATLAYAFQPQGRADRDRCLAFLRPTFGTRIEHCYAAFDGTQRTDALEWPAVGDDGSLLFGHYVSGIGDRIPDRGALRVGTVDAPFAGRVLLTLPNTVAAVGFTRIGRTAWLDQRDFLFVAQDYLMLGNLANGNKKDTTFVGLALVRGTVDGGSGQFRVVAGTDSATSFAVSARGDSIYFARYQDHRLYVIPVGGGTPLVAHTAQVDGPGFVLRDPVRLGDGIAYVVARFDQDAQPRGLLAGTRVEFVRPGQGPATALFGPAPGGGIGVLAAPSSGCQLVYESRSPAGISWTTDLAARCASGCNC